MQLPNDFRLARASADVWRRQRRLINPFFTTVSVASMVDHLRNPLATLMAKWRKKLSEGVAVDLIADYSLFTMEVRYLIYLQNFAFFRRIQLLFQVICRSAFGITFDFQRTDNTELIGLIKWFLRDSQLRSFQPDFLEKIFTKEKAERAKKIAKLVRLMKVVIQEYHR